MSQSNLGEDFLPELVKQLGFCLVCGNAVHSDQEMERLENGVCHDECL
jgi:hypothetical protein